MTDTTETQAVEQLRASIAGHLLTIPQTRLAKEAGLSAPTVSQWMGGKYKGNNATVEEKLTAWLATSARSSAVRATIAPERVGWVETPTFFEIESAFVLARELPSISVIYGPPGIGKTSASKRYASTTPNVWRVNARQSTGSMAAILKQIGIAVNVRGGYRNYELSQDIISRITGTHGLLVIDEFQHLTFPAREEVRAIHDASEIGVALVGNEAGWAKMTGGTRRLDHAQLFSRCAPVLHLYGSTEGDVNAILEAWRITDKALKEYALQIAIGAGGLRVLVKMLEQAALFAPEGGTPDVAAMRAAYEEIGGTL